MVAVRRALGVGLLLLAGCSGDDTQVVWPDAAADGTAPADGGGEGGAGERDTGAEGASDATLDASGDGGARETGAEAGDGAQEADAAPVGVGCDRAGYPSGPYGTAIGAVVANLALGGFVGGAAPLVTLCLGRYHATGPKLLVIHWTSAWSSTCQSEEPAWVQLAAKNAGEVVFLEAMAENVVGLPATNTMLEGWAGRFHVTNDLAMDPAQTLGAYFASDAGVPWPSHLLVRTDTMQIVTVHVGGLADASEVQGEIDAALARDAGAE